MARLVKLDFQQPTADKKVYLFTYVGVIDPTIAIEILSWDSDEEMEREIGDYALARDIHALNQGESFAIEGNPSNTITRLM